MTKSSSVKGIFSRLQVGVTELVALQGWTLTFCIRGSVKEVRDLGLF